MTYTVKIETITPAIAERMLQKNPINRVLSQSTIERYAADMRDGLWDFTGESISVFEDGSLADGQHRLHGVVRSGVTVQMVVVRGIKQKAMRSFDNGKRRSAGDILSIFGVADPKLVAAAGRLAMNYAHSRPVRGTPGRIAVTGFVEENRHLEEVVARTKKVANFVPFSPFAAPLFLSTAGGDHRELIEPFVDGVLTGCGIGIGDPRYTLREWIFAKRRQLKNNHLPVEEVFCAVTRAWNAFVAGRDLKVLKMLDEASHEALPIVGFDPSLF